MLMLRYQFPAVKGCQAGKDYYICMIPLGLMSRIFTIDYSDVSAEYRAQRRLNESRIPEICDYILSIFRLYFTFFGIGNFNDVFFTYFS